MLFRSGLLDKQRKVNVFVFTTYESYRNIDKFLHSFPSYILGEFCSILCLLRKERHNPLGGYLHTGDLVNKKKSFNKFNTFSGKLRSG